MQGEAEATVIVQPGEGMASGRPNSSLQHLQEGHLQKVEPLQ